MLPKMAAVSVSEEWNFAIYNKKFAVFWHILSVAVVCKYYRDTLTFDTESQDQAALFCDPFLIAKSLSFPRSWRRPSAWHCDHTDCCCHHTAKRGNIRWDWTLAVWLASLPNTVRRKYLLRLVELDLSGRSELLWTCPLAVEIKRWCWMSPPVSVVLNLVC